MKEIAFQLPFTGSWFVFWGGATKAQNYHHSDVAEKYALDLVVLDGSGQTYSGSGEHNEDYYAFGQEILAAADGTASRLLTATATILRKKRPITTLTVAIL